MHLCAAIRPPWPVISHLEAAIRPAWQESARDTIRWTYPAHWRIQLSDFGDVVRSDIPELCAVIAAEVAAYPPPTLRLSGRRADPERTDGVWIGVDGDRDIVGDIAGSIPGWVARFGFALDRRAYSSEVQLARTGPHLPHDTIDALAVRLREYEGRPWTADAVIIGRETPATPECNANFVVVEKAFFDGMTEDSSA
jgi:hypothetical protein